MGANPTTLRRKLAVAPNRNLCTPPAHHFKANAKNNVDARDCTPRLGANT